MSSYYPPNNTAATCPRCGKQLMPGKRQCIHCGFFMPQGQPNVAQQNFNQQTNNWQMPQQQGGQPQPFAPWQGQGQNSPASGQPWGQSSSPNSFPQQPGQTGFAPFPPLPAQPQRDFQSSPVTGGFPNSGGFQQRDDFPNSGGFQAGNYQSGELQNDFGVSPQNYQMQTGDFQLNKSKSGPGAGRFVVIALVLLVLIGGSFGGYYFLKQSGNPGSSGGTGVPLPPTTSAPIFKDEFNNNTNGWDLTSKPGSFSAKIAAGSMVLEDDNHLLLPALLPSEKTKNIGNFRISVDGNLTRGDAKNGYGMIIRCSLNQSGDLSNYYGFEVYGDGTYVIFKRSINSQNTSATRVQLGGDLDNPNGLIQKSGTVNHMTVIAKGGDMQFFMNGQLLTTVQDTSFRSGLAALFVSNVSGTTGGAQATFSHLAVYRG